MSATFTVPPGPPLYGSIPKSVCFALNVPTARIESGPIITSAVTGTRRVVPAIVTRSGNDIFPLRASSDSAANRISG